MSLGENPPSKPVVFFVPYKQTNKNEAGTEGWSCPLLRPNLPTPTLLLAPHPHQQPWGSLLLNLAQLFLLFKIMHPLDFYINTRQVTSKSPRMACSRPPSLKSGTRLSNNLLCASGVYIFLHVECWPCMPPNQHHTTWTCMIGGYFGFLISHDPTNVTLQPP